MIVEGELEERAKERGRNEGEREDGREGMKEGGRGRGKSERLGKGLMSYIKLLPFLLFFKVFRENILYSHLPPLSHDFHP